MKIKSLIIAGILATSVAHADQEPLEITIPIYSLYTSGMSLQSMNVDSVYPDSNSNTVVMGDVLQNNSSFSIVRSGPKGQTTSVFTRGTNSNHTLSYASGSGTNRLTFELAIAAGNAATDAGDVLSIGANAIALNSGFITEKATEKFVLEAGTNDGSADEFIELEGDTAGRIMQELNTASTITNSAAIGTAAGTITVSA